MLLPKKPFSQPMKPRSALGVGGTAAGAGAAARVAAGTGLSTTGLGSTTGAGASGSTPLITGDCLLVGSCERRVMVVGSSNSSAIL